MADKKYINLNMTEIIKVSDAVRTMVADLPSMTMTKLMAELRGRIDFDFTENNVASVLKSLELKCARAKTTPKEGSANKQRIAILETAVKHLEENYKTVHSLCIRLTSRLRETENELGIKKPELTALPK